MATDARTTLLYHFCRLQVPGVALPPAAFERHLRRTFELFRTKEPAVTWDAYLDGVSTTDWYVCHASRLTAGAGTQALPEGVLALPLPASASASAEGRWHEAFCLAARESLGELTDAELLILGLRLRCRMSQREVAHLLGVHEGTVSRQTDKLRDRCLEQIKAKLLAKGWTGDDLQ